MIYFAYIIINPKNFPKFVLVANDMLAFRYDLLKHVGDQNNRYWDVFGFDDLVEKIFRLYSDSAVRVRI